MGLENTLKLLFLLLIFFSGYKLLKVWSEVSKKWLTYFVDTMLQSTRNAQNFSDEIAIGVIQAKNQADEIQKTLQKLKFRYERQRKMENDDRLNAWPQVWGQKIINSQFIVLNIAMFLQPIENYQNFFRCNSSIRKISKVYFERTNLSAVFRVWSSRRLYGTWGPIDPMYDLSKYVYNITCNPTAGQTVQIMNFPGYGSHLLLGQVNLFDFHGSLAFDVLVLFRLNSKVFRLANVSIQDSTIFLTYETEMYKRPKRDSKGHSRGYGSYVWYINTTIEIPLIGKAGKQFIDESHIMFSQFHASPPVTDVGFTPIPRQRFSGIHDQHLPITKMLVLQMKITKD